MKNNNYLITIACIIGLIALTGLFSCQPGNQENVFYINDQSDFDKYKNETFPAASMILFSYD